MIIKYNDNELLYLISEKDDIALELLINKYEPLIKSRLIAYKIKRNNFDDFYQECLMTTYNCIEKYNPEKGATFNKYLDMSINFCIRNLLKKEKSYFYDVVIMDTEDLDYVVPLQEESYNDISLTGLSEYEQMVVKCLGEGMSIQDISVELNKDCRSIYNSISRIKSKVKKTQNKSGEKIIKENIDTNNIDNNISMEKPKNEDGLSDLERRVYNKYKLGFKASEIAYFFGMDVPNVYNALKRAKKKINSNLIKN